MHRHPQVASANVEQQSETTTQHQAIFEEQRGETTALTEPNPGSVYGFVEYGMPTSEMSMSNLLENPVLIDTVSWSATDAKEAELGSFLLPELIGSKTNFQQLVLQTNTYFKPHFKVEFKINTPQFYFGRLIISFDPFSQLTPPNRTDYSMVKQARLSTLTGYPSTYLDAGYANSAVLSIPFKHIQSYLTTNSKETFDLMGKVRLTVLNELRTVDGMVNHVDIQVFLSVYEVDLKVPVAPHPTIIPDLAFIPNPSDHLLALREDSEWTLTETHGGLVSSLSGTVEKGIGVGRKAASAFANVTTGNFSGAAHDVGDAANGVGDILKTFDLDKPLDPTHGCYKAIKPLPPLAHMWGVDGSIRLGEGPMGGNYQADADSGGSPLEQDLGSLAQRQMLVTQIPWTTDQTAYTVIKTIPILPSFTDYTLPQAVGATQYSAYGTVETFLSYISASYAAWRGSFKFRVDFVASGFHRGKIAFSFVPNQSVTIPSGENLTNFPTKYFSLAEERSTSFTIPYVASTPYKWWSPWASLTSRGRLTDEEILGQLYIWITVPLTAPSNVYQSIEMNVYMGAAPDFEFMFPRLKMGTEAYTFEIAGPDDETVTRADNEDIPTNTTQESKDCLLAGGRLVSDLNAYTEHRPNAKAYGRRSGCVWWGQLNWTSIGPPTTTNPNVPSQRWVSILSLPVTPFIYTLTSDDDWARSPGASSAIIPMCRMSRMFALWSGSIRYKVVPYTNRDSQTILASATYDPTNGEYVGDTTYPFDKLNQLPLLYGSPTDMTNLTQDCVLQVECGANTILKNLLVETTETAFHPNTLKAGNVIFVFYNTSVTPDTPPDPLQIQIFASAGEDFRLSYPVAPPLTYSNLDIPAPPSIMRARKEAKRAFEERKRALTTTNVV
jgi:hypothetical protein